jgi:hypothetical protein
VKSDVSEPTEFASVGPYAFLFNSRAKGLGGYYGYPCCRAVLTALLAADPTSVVAVRLYVGDLLFHHLCESIAGVEVDPGASTNTLKLETNANLLSALQWELAGSIAVQWPGVDEVTIGRLLGSASLFVVSMPTLPQAIALAIDADLGQAAGYVGMVAIDASYPVERLLFFEFLCRSGFVRDRSLFVRAPWPGEYSEIPDWARDVPFASVHELEAELYREQLPDPCPTLPPGARARFAKTAFRQYGKRTNEQRIAEALYLAPLERKEHPLALSVPPLSDVSEAEVAKSRLLGYSLNTAHHDGRHKAALFSALLGIEAADWRFLAAQLVAGLSVADLADLRTTSWGHAQWSADIQVRGRNGVIKTVRTAWKLAPGAPVQLLTAYVSPNRTQSNVPPAYEVVVPTAALRHTDFAELFERAKTAGIAAAAAAVPPPMLVADANPAGGCLVREGPIGDAFVTVRDARQGFARWLRKAGIGYAERRKGQRVYAEIDSQSMERARAYCKAFAEILRENGIDCSVHWYLD